MVLSNQSRRGYTKVETGVAKRRKTTRCIPFIHAPISFRMMHIASTGSVITTHNSYRRVPFGALWGCRNSVQCSNPGAAYVKPQSDCLGSLSKLDFYSFIVCSIASMVWYCIIMFDDDDAVWCGVLLLLLLLICFLAWLYHSLVRSFNAYWYNNNIIISRQRY